MESNKKVFCWLGMSENLVYGFVLKVVTNSFIRINSHE